MTSGFRVELKVCGSGRQVPSNTLCAMAAGGRSIDPNKAEATTVLMAASTFLNWLLKKECIAKEHASPQPNLYRPKSGRRQVSVYMIVFGLPEDYQ
jgi:hypothetical protein